MKTKSKTSKLDIFLIEDNQDDIFLTELAVKELGIQGSNLLAKNGENAIELLNELVKEKKKLPDLILLDINLPKINGIDVLKEIKSNSSTNLIPTVIFTSSDSMADMKYCYENGADLYIRKPNNINEYKKIMKYIKDNCLSL